MLNTSKENSETLHQAAGSGNIKVIQAIIDEDSVDLLEEDSRNKVALHYALMFSVQEDPNRKAAKLSIADLLIKNAPDALSHGDDAGNTPVYLMALANLDGLLGEAINRNPSLAWQANNNGTYPIHTAIANHCDQAVDRLLTVDKMADLIDSDECSLIHHGAAANNTHVLHYLFKNFKDCVHEINLLDQDGDTALDIAISRGYQDVCKLLKEHGGKTHDEISHHKPK